MNNDVLDGLSENTKDYWVTRSIPVLHNPTPLQFLREAVCAYHPVIITGAISTWPALQKWNKDYLIKTLGDRRVNVNLTPDGHGDCVKKCTKIKTIHDNSNSSVSYEADEPKDYFVYPAEHDMSISEFFELLETGHEQAATVVPVPYLSQQNDNLRQSMPELLEDIETSIQLANEAFGSFATSESAAGMLEAVNLWIGDERSVSSIHKDHYENMYAVIAGEKTFTLLPPTDTAFLTPYTLSYPTLQYKVVEPNNPPTSPLRYIETSTSSYNNTNKITPPIHSSDTTNLQLELQSENCPSEQLEWLPLDTNDPEVSYKYPLYKKTTPIQCTVHAGEILYIPAMWYHRVSQNCLTISVNYWYDQKFDFRYSFFYFYFFIFLFDYILFYRFVFYQTIKRIVENNSNNSSCIGEEQGNDALL